MLSHISTRPRLWRVALYLTMSVAAVMFIVQYSLPSSSALSADHLPVHRLSVEATNAQVRAAARQAAAQLAGDDVVTAATAAKQVQALTAQHTAQLLQYLAALHNAQLLQYLAALHNAQVTAAANAAAAQAAAARAAAAKVAPVPAAPVIPAAAPATPAGDTVTPAQRAAWDKVNMCEEGGRWNVEGPVYSGGLGFSHANWAEFNTFGFPADAADATPDQQIQVATAFAARYYGSADAAPDQNGCGGGY